MMFNIVRDSREISTPNTSKGFRFMVQKFLINTKLIKGLRFRGFEKRHNSNVMK